MYKGEREEEGRARFVFDKKNCSSMHVTVTAYMKKSSFDSLKSYPPQ